MSGAPDATRIGTDASNSETSQLGSETGDLLNAPMHDARPPLGQYRLLLEWAACLFLMALGLYLDKAKPFEQYIGNRLNDPIISYPHTPRDKQQIDSRKLWFLALWGPLGAIILLKAVFPGGRRELNRAVLGLCSSLSLALTLICLIKNNVGRLRPDFLARCVPVNGLCSHSGPEVMEGRKSFPSGHSGLSFAGLGYLALYMFVGIGQLQAGRWQYSLWRVILAGCPWCIALWVAFSRLQDYWHHWEDILVGGLLGHACAISMYKLQHHGEPLGTVDKSISTSGCKAVPV